MVKLKEREDKRRRREARRNEEARKVEILRKKGIDPSKLGSVAAEVYSRIGELDGNGKLSKQPKKDESNWYHPREHWWEMSESETGDIPCKDSLPAPPRSLNNIDKGKYQMQNFLHNGQLIEEKKN